MKKTAQALLAALVVPTLSVGGVWAMAKILENKAHAEFPLTTGRMRNSPQKSLATAEQIAHGRRLFVQSCVRCHGNDARGKGEDDDGPDLHGLRVSDARLQSVILKGVKGEMPSFAKKFSPDDTAALISYLRSLPRD